MIEKRIKEQLEDWESKERLRHLEEYKELVNESGGATVFVDQPEVDKVIQSKKMDFLAKLLEQKMDLILEEIRK